MFNSSDFLCFICRMTGEQESGALIKKGGKYEENSEHAFGFEFSNV